MDDIQNTCASEELGQVVTLLVEQDRFVKYLMAKYPRLIPEKGQATRQVRALLENVPDCGEQLADALDRFSASGGKMRWGMKARNNTVGQLHKDRTIELVAHHMPGCAFAINTAVHELTHEHQNKVVNKWFPSPNDWGVLTFKKLQEAHANAVSSWVGAHMFADALQACALHDEKEYQDPSLCALRVAIFAGLTGYTGSGTVQGLKELYQGFADPNHDLDALCLNVARRTFDAVCTTETDYPHHLHSPRARNVLEQTVLGVCVLPITALSSFFGVENVMVTATQLMAGTPSFSTAFSAGVTGVFIASSTYLTDTFNEKVRDCPNAFEVPDLTPAQTKTALTVLGDLSWLGANRNFMTETTGGAGIDDAKYYACPPPSAKPFVDAERRAVQFLRPIHRAVDRALRVCNALPLPRL